MDNGFYTKSTIKIEIYEKMGESDSKFVVITNDSDVDKYILTGEKAVELVKSIINAIC